VLATAVQVFQLIHLGEVQLELVKTLQVLIIMLAELAAGFTITTTLRLYHQELAELAAAVLVAMLTICLLL
jgi:hypothetical protein